MSNQKYFLILLLTYLLGNELEMVHANFYDVVTNSFRKNNNLILFILFAKMRRKMLVEIQTSIRSRTFPGT